MDFKQEPSDPYVGAVNKTEPDVVSGQKEENNWCPTKQEPFKHDHVPGFGNNNNRVYQATQCFVNADEIKQEAVECAVPKIEYKLSDFPVKIECKKEFDVPDIIDISEIKQEISDSEYFQAKTERDLLTSHIDLPTLKSESTGHLDNFAQPCSSKYAGRTLKSLKTTTNFVSKKKKLYPCLVCTKNFPSKSRSKHIGEHFGKSFVVCELCGRLMTNVEFFRHYFIHVVKNKPRKVSLEIDIHHTNDKPFKCDICFKQFKRKCKLNVHLIIHTNKKPFKCNICFKGFKRKSGIKQHLIIHTNEKIFKCNICFKRFKRKRELKKHLIIHTDQKTSQCDICFKEFKRKYSLQTHLKEIHSDEKPFKCDICFKEFKRKSDVKQHLLSHTDEKAFRCDICFKALKSKFSLQEHLKIIHSDEKQFKCDICFREFKRKYSLQEHLKVIHSDKKPFKCDICSKEFKRKCDVKQHLFSHTDEKTFKCDICSKGLKSKYSLQEHLKIIHSDKKPFKCGICFREFKRKYSVPEHLKLIHGDEKPYKCDKCSQKFKRHSDLNLHLLIHTN